MDIDLAKLKPPKGVHFGIVPNADLGGPTPSSTQAPTQVASDMLLMIQQVDTHLAQLYARTACGEQLSPAELHQCKQLLEWRAQVSKN